MIRVMAPHLSNPFGCGDDIPTLLRGEGGGAFMPLYNLKASIT